MNMAHMEGKYANEKNENLDEYFKGLGDMRITPTTAMELITGLSPLDLYVEKVVLMAMLRLHTAGVNLEVGMGQLRLSLWREAHTAQSLLQATSDAGVPYIPRKLICSSRPTMEISKNNDEWTISTSTMFRTSSSKFKFGEEYEETMPGGIIKNVTQMEGDNKLITTSVGPGEVRSSRKYEFIGDECVITYTSDQSPQVAKRYFKRC